MLFCPVQSTARLNLLGKEWVTVAPRVTQAFGENPQIYEQFGMIAHNGVDIGSNGDDNIFAAHSGYIKIKEDAGGYGLHIRIRDGAKETTYAHLNKVYVQDGQYIHACDKIGQMGDTGFSFGKHLHFGLRYLIPSDENRWKWQVKNYDNGYFGAVDPAPFMVRWKGTLANSTLK